MGGETPNKRLGGLPPPPPPPPPSLGETRRNYTPAVSSSEACVLAGRQEKRSCRSVIGGELFLWGVFASSACRLSGPRPSLQWLRRGTQGWDPEPNRAGPSCLMRQQLYFNISLPSNQGMVTAGRTTARLAGPLRYPQICACSPHITG